MKQYLGPGPPAAYSIICENCSDALAIYKQDAPQSKQGNVGPKIPMIQYSNVKLRRPKNSPNLGQRWMSQRRKKKSTLTESRPEKVRPRPRPSPRIRL